MALECWNITCVAKSKKFSFLCLFHVYLCLMGVQLWGVISSSPTWLVHLIFYIWGISQLTLQFDIGWILDLPWISGHATWQWCIVCINGLGGLFLSLCNFQMVHKEGGITMWFGWTYHHFFRLDWFCILQGGWWMLTT
jgi:hypothetical protein